MKNKSGMFLITTVVKYVIKIIIAVKMCIRDRLRSALEWSGSSFCAT